jgi:hypothetical protein
MQGETVKLKKKSKKEIPWSMCNCYAYLSLCYFTLLCECTKLNELSESFKYGFREVGSIKKDQFVNFSLSYCSRAMTG